MPPTVPVKLETAIGTVDGVNAEFQTSLDYEPSQLRVFFDGVLIKRVFDDGFFELYNRTFQLKSPPPLGTKLSVFYPVRTSPYPPPTIGRTYGVKYGKQY
jgi:hypothetical protein